MESGLEDRNNQAMALRLGRSGLSLNGVRPRRPEQYRYEEDMAARRESLNGVRPRRPEQSGLEPRSRTRGRGSQWSPA